MPFPAYQVFQRGGYFSVEVIPNSVAVISLNTMYFYDSNTGAISPHCHLVHQNSNQVSMTTGQLWEAVCIPNRKTPGTSSWIGWKSSCKSFVKGRCRFGPGDASDWLTHN